MAIDGEPKDGNFVRYIETLTRAGGTEPGRVQDPPPRLRRTRARAAAVTSPAPAASPSAGHTTEPEPRPATLAARTSLRRIALGLTIAALIAAWNAVRLLARALHSQSLQLDELVPAVFLAVCAFMLFKGASRLRATHKTPMPTLPPLSTLPDKASHRS